VVHRQYIGNEKVPVPIEFASFTASTSVVAITSHFTAEELDQANAAVFSVNGGQLHYRYDGGNPTGAAGLMLDDSGGDATAVVFGEVNVKNLKFIKEAGGPDVTVSVQLERRGHMNYY